jgi:hypothetical protein
MQKTWLVKILSARLKKITEIKKDLILLLRFLKAYINTLVVIIPPIVYIIYVVYTYVVYVYVMDFLVLIVFIL